MKLLPWWSVRMERTPSQTATAGIGGVLWYGSQDKIVLAGMMLMVMMMQWKCRSAAGGTAHSDELLI
jgi:hypothetical protein